MNKISRNADISFYTMKTLAVGDPTTSGVWGATCVSPLIAIQEQETQSASLHKLSQRGERVLRLAGTAISYTKKNPLSAHHIGILRAQKRVKLVLFGCRVLRHGKGTKKIRDIIKNLPKIIHYSGVTIVYYKKHGNPYK